MVRLMKKGSESATSISLDPAAGLPSGSKRDASTGPTLLCAPPFIVKAALDFVPCQVFLARRSAFSAIPKDAPGARRA